MFGFFSKGLTESSKHYIDWSRIGNLITAGNHRYNREEILTRGGIIVFTFFSALFGAYINKKTSSDYSDYSAACMAGIMGFLVSHAVVVTPLIVKRCKVSQECDQLIKKIKQKITLYPETTQSTVLEFVHTIQTLSLSDREHGKASQTWGCRKRLLTTLHDLLQSTDLELLPKILECFANTLENTNASHSKKITI